MTMFRLNFCTTHAAFFVVAGFAPDLGVSCISPAFPFRWFDRRHDLEEELEALTELHVTHSLAHASVENLAPAPVPSLDDASHDFDSDVSDSFGASLQLPARIQNPETEAHDLPASAIEDHSRHSLTDASAAAAPAVSLDDLRHSFGSDFWQDASGSEDFDASLAHKDFSNISDMQLNELWGRDARLCSLKGTLADPNERDVVVGDQVFVLQLEWGDDSLGPLRNRLEAKVEKIDDNRRPGQVCLK
jgi:hypothetical protein